MQENILGGQRRGLIQELPDMRPRLDALSGEDLKGGKDFRMVRKGFPLFEF